MSALTPLFTLSAGDLFTYGDAEYRVREGEQNGTVTVEQTATGHVREHLAATTIVRTVPFVVTTPRAKVTTATAARVADRTAAIVAKFRADADAAERAGDLDGANALRTLADSRERAGARVRVGANIRAAR